MTPQAYLYICDGDIDRPVLTHKKMNWSEKYPHWQEIPLVMAQRQWAGLTDWEINAIAQNNHPLDGIRTFARAIEAKLKEKNT